VHRAFAVRSCQSEIGVASAMGAAFNLQGYATPPQVGDERSETTAVVQG